jgi:hypothetical protein
LPWQLALEVNKQSQWYDVQRQEQQMQWQYGSMAVDVQKRVRRSGDVAEV